MPEANDRLFDALWALSDEAEKAGLPELASKLEEAMDTYLAECQPDETKPVAFQSYRYARANRQAMEQAHRNVRAKKLFDMLNSGGRTGLSKRRVNKPVSAANNDTATTQHSSARFSWPV